MHWVKGNVGQGGAALLLSWSIRMHPFGSTPRLHLCEMSSPRPQLMWGKRIEMLGTGHRLRELYRTQTKQQKLCPTALTLIYHLTSFSYSSHLC